jgi:hypothetical protein
VDFPPVKGIATSHIVDNNIPMGLQLKTDHKQSFDSRHRGVKGIFGKIRTNLIGLEREDQRTLPSRSHRFSYYSSICSNFMLHGLFSTENRDSAFIDI